MLRSCQKYSVLGIALRVALSTLTAMAGYAHAQQRPADEKATAKPPQSTTLEEVVVTATRREENLQNVPISVLAFDAAKLADRGVNTLQDIERFAPNVLFAGRGATPASGFITMRGLFDSPRNIGSEQRVGIYTDGIYLGRTYNLDQSVLGLQRVEVLRGPQGTLFGKATPAGAISLTTREPTGD